MNNKNTWRAWLLAAVCVPLSAHALGLELVNLEPGAFPDRTSHQIWYQVIDLRLARRVPDPEERQYILDLVQKEAAKVNLAPELVLAVIQVESNFDRWAISSAGAIGLMQVMPFWLKKIGRPGDNLFHPETNIRMGCQILRHYLDMERGNLIRALARYNGSLGSYRYPNMVIKAFNRWMAVR